MKYKYRLMSTKLLIILNCCKSNSSQNTQLIGGAKETFLTSKKTHKENKLTSNSNIQDTDPPVSL